MKKQILNRKAVPEFPTSELLNWYFKNRRSMPWRKIRDPYRIWVSEIMLQQTRVETVIPYYLRFVKAFPTVHELASADRQTVLKMWEGLGYYSRARNLHDAAKIVSEDFQGSIPDTYNEITELKGVGPYTAAALLSIAFRKPYAVVDGNVLRVFSRFFGIDQDIRSQTTKKQIQNLADRTLDRQHPGEFNQAVMELGATVCSPSAPCCTRCPLSAGCIALRTAATDKIPFKSPTKKIPHHQIGVGLLVVNGKLLIALRPENVMLGGLWEFPGGKKEDGEEITTTVRREFGEELDISITVLDKFMKVKHTYSHFRITMHAYWCRMDPPGQQPDRKSSQEIRCVTVGELKQYPFPKANKMLIEKLENEGLAI